MREGWKSARLGEVSEMIKRGIAPKYTEAGGVCVINQKCVRDHSINYALARRHDIDAKKVPQERFIQLGDVLVNSTGTGTLGRVAQVRSEPPEPATVDTHVTIVRPNDGSFYHDFFGYMLIKIEDEIIKSGEGASGQTELARSKIENQFVVSFPESIAEQKRIVAILDEAFAGIDAAIANTEKNLSNARELFESSLRQLFFCEAEGWVSSTIGEMVENGILRKPLDGNHGSIHPKKADYVNDGVPFIMASDLLNGSVDQKGCSFISRKQADSLRKGFALNGDVLLSHKGTIGRSAVLETELDYVMLTPQVTYYRVADGGVLYNRFIYYFFQSPGFIRELKHIAGAGSTRAYIGIIKQLELPVSYPLLEIQKDIVTKLDSIILEVRRLQAIYQQKLTALAELKQSLLHKAFSGELTAREAEAEEATA